MIVCLCLDEKNEEVYRVVKYHLIGYICFPCFMCSGLGI